MNTSENQISSNWSLQVSKYIWMLKNGPKDYLNILSFPRVNKTILKIYFDAPKGPYANILTDKKLHINS